MSICRGVAGLRGGNPRGIFIHNDAGSQNANAAFRAGELAGITVYALLNHTFSCANRSTKGVTSSGKPSLPHKSARC